MSGQGLAFIIAGGSGMILRMPFRLQEHSCWGAVSVQVLDLLRRQGIAWLLVFPVCVCICVVSSSECCSYFQALF